MGVQSRFGVNFRAAMRGQRRAAPPGLPLWRGGGTGTGRHSSGIAPLRV